MKKKIVLCFGLSLMTLLSACNSQGVEGPKGDPGEQGEPGLNGSDGKDGLDGSKIYTGVTNPNDSLGVEGDIYINTSTGDIYTKGASSWGNVVGNVKGDTGSDGVSIIDAYIDGDGYLVCEMSDGRTIKAGKVKDTTKYKVEFYFKDILVDTRENVVSGSKIEPPSSTILPVGYTVDYWFVKENGLESPWAFSGCTVTSDLKLYAHYVANSYTITLDSNGGDEYDPIMVEYCGPVSLPTPSKAGYAFDYWALSSSPDEAYTDATYTFTCDIALMAHWSVVLQTLTVASADNDKGTATIVSGAGYTDESIVIQAEPKNGYLFAGWYKGDELLAYESKYTFTMPAESYAITAKFVVNPVPVIDSESKTVTYGLYPQTHVSNTSLINSLNALTETTSNGWYLYDGNYYVKVTASPNESGYTFSDGTTIYNKTDYWFECKPITWKILAMNDDEYTLVSTVLLDKHNFYGANGDRTVDGETIYANDYQYSDIRSWLNGSFYSNAFSLNSAYVETIEVNNAASTTQSSSTEYACENTNDNVYLLSYRDYCNSGYGFVNDAARQCKPTDYAKAVGVYCKGGYGSYFTRSPDDSYSYLSAVVTYAGDFQSVNVASGSHGVRPSITLKIGQ